MNSRSYYVLYTVAPIFHCILSYVILYFADITIKTPIFWAILINNLLSVYFIFISGAAFGIKQTLLRLAAESMKKKDNFIDN